MRLPKESSGKPETLPIRINRACQCRPLSANKRTRRGRGCESVHSIQLVQSRPEDRSQRARLGRSSCSQTHTSENRKRRKAQPRCRFDSAKIAQSVFRGPGPSSGRLIADSAAIVSLVAAPKEVEPLFRKERKQTFAAATGGLALAANPKGRHLFSLAYKPAQLMRQPALSGRLSHLGGRSSAYTNRSVNFEQASWPKQVRRHRLQLRLGTQGAGGCTSAEPDAQF